MATEDKRLTELATLTSPATNDRIYVVDVSDTTESDEGTSKQALLNGLAREPGNVLNFGADPTGATDSYPAFQAAANSDYPMIAHGGKFRLDDTVTITKPKVIRFLPGLRTAYEGQSGASDVALEGEQTRIFSTNNINFFDIQCEQVYGTGGCFDTQGITNHDKAIFYMPLVCNGGSAGGNADYGGWAGGWDKFIVLGDFDTMATNGKGTIVVHCDTTNSTVNNAYWYFWKYQGVCYACQYGLYAPERSGTYTQTLNNWEFEIQANSTKTAIYNKSMSQSKFKVRHQGRHMFATQADAIAHPSCVSTFDSVWDCKFYDFSTSAVGGLWSNQRTYDTTGNDAFAELEQIDEDKAVQLQNKRFDPPIRGARGIFPRYRTTQHEKVFIPELHDLIYAYANQANNITIQAYRGDDVYVSDYETDFLALTGDSATNGITTSSDITVNNSGNLFLMEGTSMSITFNNASAISRRDYVEIHIDGAGAQPLAWLLLLVANTDDKHFEFIQIQRYTGGTQTDNIFTTVTDLSQTELQYREHEFELSGNGTTDLIIRIIGFVDPSSAGGGLGVSGVYGSANNQDNYNPTVYRHGGPMYGNLEFKQGGVTDRTETTTNLEDASHEVNTSAYKKEGLCVFNATTNKPVWATGNGDTDTWVDATGTTAHTPS